MEPVLERAIIGEEVSITLEGKHYTLAYPMEAVILYKRETAFLDRARNFGNAKLTRAEISELRDARRKLLEEADALRPAEDDKWSDANFARFEAFFADAQALKVAIDLDAGTGDSLYDKQNWWKISPDGDPERLRLALWVGLHTFDWTLPPGRQYVESISREKLGALVHLGNGEELTIAISKALRRHLIVADTAEEEAPPNGEPPVAPAVDMSSQK